jgi:hypothetical protein
MITVRDIDPADKRWLKAEAKRLGISMEELARRAIREKRERAGGGEKPSEVIRRLFGPESEIDLGARAKFKLRPKPVKFGE